MSSLFLTLLLLFLFDSSAAHRHRHSCSSSLPTKPCPPFRSPPTEFPFSSSPGCGHPSFQIHCSSPHSILTINSSPFLLLSHHPPNTLNITPYLPSCPSLPTKPINISSPFRLLSDPCPLLSSLRPHSQSPQNRNLSCPLSHYQTRLLSDPSKILLSCNSSSNRIISSSKNDLLDFLRAGILVEYDLSSDPYSSNCSSCDGGCGFDELSISKPFLCYPPPHIRRRSVHRRFLPLLIAMVLFSVGCFLIFATIGFFLRRRRWRSNLRCNPMMAAELIGGGAPIYGYDTLRAATGGFDVRNKIGSGGFGAVFLARLDDGRSAAVKRLHHRPAAAAAFRNEVLILSSLRHPNLVRLHGYCPDPRGLLLVYDYVPNGTLADHLHRFRSLLAWPVRVDIALQVASALEYLHCLLKPPVVHRDVTSSNIFVERDMRIKVGDFGLSRLLSMPDPDSSEYVCCTGPQGTPGYLDPDYHRSFRLTEKSDVYSFGVVLLELVTGMKAVDLAREKGEVSLAELAVSRIQSGALGEVVDPVLVVQGEGKGTVEAVAELAFRCVAGEKDDRPDAREMVEELRRIRGMI